MRLRGVVVTLVWCAATWSAGARADTRTIDGTGNNETNVLWGSVGEDLLRTAPVGYADGVSEAIGQPARPSARVISNTVSEQTPGLTQNNRNMSAFIYAWGQFLDHDLDLTLGGVSESLPITVPAGDAFFNPAVPIDLTRSGYNLSTGTDAGNPRQQVNTVTAFIDGSMVYGSDTVTAALLRTAGGKLATSAGNLLPVDGSGFFVAGDVRVNENIELTAVQTLFVREHNRLADAIAAASPGMNDEEIYQAARRIVGAEIQAITYNEFLPALLGPGALGAYTGYNPAVNPGVANEFATAAFRLGHSMLQDDVRFIDNDGNEARPGVELAEAFFNPQLVKDNGIDTILKFLATSNAEEVDTHVVDGLRNFLFGLPGAGGFDLVSLNIQRGRDHGLADYNSTRLAYGLSPVADFSDITSDVNLAAELELLYGDVSNIDLWVGGLAEDHVVGGSVGELIRAILADQFTRLRDGDRFFYLGDDELPGLLSLAGMSFSEFSLSWILMANTELTTIQSNAFFFVDTSVPEPSTLAVLGAAVMLGRVRGRRSRR